MRIRNGKNMALVLGIIAGVLRLLQYALVTDEQGYLTTGTLSKTLEIGLCVVLILGVAVSIFFCSGKKLPFGEEKDLEELNRCAKPLFWLLALVALARAVVLLLDGGQSGFLPAAVQLLGAIGWAGIAWKGCEAVFFTLLPLVQMGGSVIFYFWATYKFLHIPEYTLGMMGLCACLLLTLQLLRGFAGVKISQERLSRDACLVLALSFAAFPAAIGRLLCGVSMTADVIVLAVQGILYIGLALLVLAKLPFSEDIQKESSGPNLEEMNEFISDLPDIKEEKENA